MTHGQSTVSVLQCNTNAKLCFKRNCLALVLMAKWSIARRIIDSCYVYFVYVSAHLSLNVILDGVILRIGY